MNLLASPETVSYGMSRQGLFADKIKSSLASKTMHQIITRRFLLLSMVLFAATVVPYANSQVLVQDTNVQFSGGTLFPFGPDDALSSQILTVFQTPDSSAALSDPTSVVFNASPSSLLLTGTTVALDEGVDLYVAQLGDVFSLDTIQAGDFQPLVVGSTFSSNFAEINNQGPDFIDFFLAFATTGTDGSIAPIGADRDVFGWAQFSIDDTVTLRLVDNAVAYGSGNIIVGENASAVPEPNTAALIGFLVLGFLGRRRRQSLLAVDV